MKKAFPFVLIAIFLMVVLSGCLSSLNNENSDNNDSSVADSDVVQDSNTTCQESAQTGVETEEMSAENTEVITEETTVAVESSTETTEETSAVAVEPIDFSDMTVNCLGDSLTYGANPDGSQMASPYPALLKDALGCSAVNNFGIGGTKVSNEDSSSFCVRYENMPDADIVLVMGGTNDALSFSYDMVYRTPLGNIDDVEETTFYGALNSLCSKLKNKYPNAFIAFITPLPLADSITAWTTATGSFSVEDAGTAVKAVCAKYDIPVFDAYNLTGYGLICNEENGSGSGDGIHPNQEFWANDFTPKLAQFIRENYN